ncbi:MAG: hypothetical protein RLO52_32640 [Sandaracinaceae bacterium]|nr:MAG: hypothetical protein EVA89_26440 [Sandaracinaceae bacterium]
MRALAVLFLLALPASAAADCEVTGVASIERLRVRLPGQRLRTLAVTDTPVAVRPGRGNRYRDVRVLAPFAFAARTDAPIPWTVPTPELVAGGVLWLTPAVDLEDVREDREGEGVTVRAQVDAGVWIGRIHLPCGAVAVGHGESGPPPPAWHSQGPRWMPQHDRMWITAEPGEGPSVRLDAPEGLSTPMVEIERRDGWVRVVARFSSGAMIRGWVRHVDLRAAEDARVVERPFRRSTEHSRHALCRRRPPRQDEYVGPAHITVGTLVHTSRDGTEWASVSEPSIFTVSWRPGDRWVRVVHVPGLRGDGRCAEVIRRAWVPRSAVSLQGERSSGILLGLE